jgi:hypothetical protein
MFQNSFRRIALAHETLQPSLLRLGSGKATPADLKPQAELRRSPVAVAIRRPAPAVPNALQT